MDRPLKLTSLLPMALSACGLAFGASADAPTPTYRATVSEVRLTFSATDQSDHGVATLQAGDFAIVDRDLVIRNLRSFNRAEFTRLEVVVLVDTSGSIRQQLPKEVADVEEFMHRTAGVPEENLSIVSFQGQHPAVVCAGDCRTSHAAEQLPAQPEGLTPLFDSVLFATDLLARRADPHARKVLILLSDGEDTISQHGAAEAMESALAQEVQIYAVDTNDSAALGSPLLQRLASATGGRSCAMRDYRKLLDAVLEDFHASYTVTYQLPSRVAGYHDVRILPTRDMSLRFRHQGGYYYPGLGR